MLDDYSLFIIYYTLSELKYLFDNIFIYIKLLLKINKFNN